MKKSQKTQFSKAGMLAYFLKGSLWIFAFSIFCNFIFTLFNTVIPQIISFTIDSVIGNEPAEGLKLTLANLFGGTSFLKENIWLIAVMVVGIALVGAVFRYAYNMLHGVANQKMVKRMRNQLFSHVQRLPLAWHRQNKTGDIIQRCTSDTETISNFVSEQLISLFRIVILIALSLVFMYAMNVTLAIVATCSIPVVIIFSTIFYRVVSKTFYECDVNEGILSTYAQENFTGVRVVKAFGREIYERDKFEKQNVKYTNLWMKVCRWLAVYWGIGDFVAALQLLIITVVGTMFCINGALTAGDLVAFISYNALLTGPVRQIGRIISNMSKADVALGRICEIMNAEEEHYGEEEEGVVQGDIRFENVTFGYEKGKPVLQNISFTLPQGKSLGIIGSTGSGKSTLVELLDGLYPDYEGNIYVGEREIRTIPLTTLRRSMGMVLQEPYLYSKTVGENIAITDEEPNLENIRYAARVACIDDNINTFTKGYDTVVGERGVTLSGGQKQRAAIARTITLHTPVMIFDDSLSAVDSQTDAKIRAHLREECAGMTTILISHRITTIQHADNILVLDKGKIAEQGTNDELLKQGGIYKHIYDLQTSAAEEAGSIEEAGSVEEASAAEEAAEQKDKAEKTSAAKGVGYEH